jgi:DNA-binding CsgD family transcriptional regulator
MTPNDSFDAAVASLYETVLDAGQWNTAIARVAELFQASSAAMFRYDFATQTPSDFRRYKHDADVERLYAEYFHKVDPGRFAGAIAAVGEWLSDEQLLDVVAPTQQEYVQDFALPNGIGRVAGCKVTGDMDSCVFLGLQRLPTAPRYGDAARRTYERLHPHFQRVALLRQRVDALTTSHALATQVLDQMNFSVVVVDCLRRVRLANTQAAKAMASSRWLSLIGQRLACTQADLDDRLKALVKSACSRRAVGGAMCVPASQAGKRWLISVVPIAQSHALASAAVEPLALIAIGPPAGPGEPSHVFRLMFGLTRMEAELMRVLAGGASVAECAEQRSVSVATIRTQLRSLFEKTGATSQSRLVRLALSIAPIGSPNDSQG